MGVFRAHGDGLAECVGCEAGSFARGIAHPLKELRDDRAGISASAVQQRVSHRSQHCSKMFFGGFLEYTESGTERKTEIGTGIAIRDREDIDAIQELLLRDDTMDSRYQRLRQNIAIDVPARDFVQQVRPLSVATQKKILPLMAQHNAIGGDFGDDRALVEL